MPRIAGSARRQISDFGFREYPVFVFKINTSRLGARLAGGIAFEAVTFKNMAEGIGNIVNPKTTRRDMQSGMMVTAGRSNHMIAGNTMWNPAYRQHVLQNMGKHWEQLPAAPSTEGNSHAPSFTGLALREAFFISAGKYLRASLGQPLRLHPASVLAGLAARGQARRLRLVPSPLADRLCGFQKHRG
ncbi:hypothetical protein [Cupriavidus gilardii]|uniref:hypothetical protein n=1 Tax=Cupriavidus gilardii TaxID=82541 RepID=UPI001EE527A0|nr:hypothetical protein [Cupriavidus gilardii]MCG5260859.1 hypothetical protein [Cupriavidus gilardii]